VPKSPLQVRAESARLAKALGYPEPPAHLPLSEDVDSNYIKPLPDVVDRIASLHAVVACTFGLDGKQALIWLEQHGADRMLTAEERLLLAKKASKLDLATRLQKRIEALWALCWSVGCVEQLSFGEYCQGHLCDLLPDISTNASLAEFRAEARLRPRHEIVELADLAYCLDWAVVEAHMKDMPEPGPVDGYVICERRHALSWTLSPEEWDEVSLDT